MNRLAPELRLLVELEERQDDVLRQLDELDQRISGLLADLGPAPEGRSAAGDR